MRKPSHYSENRLRGLREKALLRQSSITDLNEKLRRKGSSYVANGRYVDCMVPVRFSCKDCGDTRCLPPTEFLSRKALIKCLNCNCRSEERRIDDHLSNVNVRRIGKYVNVRTPIKFECLSCKEKWKRVPKKENIERIRCPYCSPRNQSVAALKWMERIRCTLGIRIRDSANGGERYLNGLPFRPDGINTRYGIVFEYHGDHVHGNPAVFNLGSKSSPYSQRLTSDLYFSTLERERRIREAGYVLVRTFSDDERRGQPPMVSSLHPCKTAIKLAKMLGTFPVFYGSENETV